MTDPLIAAYLHGERSARTLMHSALPDAPQVPDGPRRRRPVTSGREGLARWLRRAAKRVEPTGRRPVQQHPAC